MRLLVDTHILVWALFAPNELTRKETRLLEENRFDIHFSAVSLYEIEQKRLAGKWDIRPVKDWADDLFTSGITHVSVAPDHAWMAANFDEPHKDPWGRIIAAQSVIEDMALMTRDQQLRKFQAITLA